MYLFGKQPDLVGGIRQIGAASYQNKGLFGVFDHHEGQLQILVLDGIGLTGHLLRRLIFIIIGIGGHVLGNIHQNRARPAGLGDNKGSSDHGSQPGDILHDKIVFSNGHGDTGDVDLLKAVTAQKAYAHITGDGHHGDRVHVSGGDAGHQVGGAGA